MSSNIRLKGRGVNRIITSKVMLSPLAGVTDNIFRRLVRRWAPNSLLFTEMINATNFKYVLFKAYSLAKSESKPSLLASQKTLANLLPTEVCALDKSKLPCIAFTFIGAIKIIIGRKIDNNVNKKNFPFLDFNSI